MSRAYTEREIAALLARAAELQQAAPDAPLGPTLSLPEVERIAAEAGLDPAHVRAAARELETGAPRTAARPGQRTLERWLDVPFSDVAWEEAVAELRHRHPGTNWAQYTAMGTLVPGGDLSRVGAAHEWRHVAWTGATTTLTASPRGARTRLRMVTGDSAPWGDRATAAVYAFTPGIVLAFVAAVLAKNATGSGWAALLAFVASFVAALALSAVLGAPAVGRSRQRRLDHAAETLDAVAAAFEHGALDGTPLAEPVVSEPAAAEALGESLAKPARLDLDALSDAPDAAPAPRRRTRA